MKINKKKSITISFWREDKKKRFVYQKEIFGEWMQREILLAIAGLSESVGELAAEWREQTHRDAASGGKIK